MQSLSTPVVKNSILGVFVLLFVCCSWLFFNFDTKIEKQKLVQNNVIELNDLVEAKSGSSNEIAISSKKVSVNPNLNASLSISSFLAAHFDEFKAMISSALSSEKDEVIAIPRSVEEIKNYKVEVLGQSFPEREMASMMMGGCPDVEVIDLRNVLGYPQLDDVNVCAAGDTLSFILFTGDPGSIKGFELELDLPTGIQYAGWEFTQLGSTSISATDPDPDRPTFLVDGITGDSLVIANVGIKANCEVDKSEMLFIDFNYSYTFIDNFNVVHKCSGTFTPSEEYNSSVHQSVLNMLSPLSPVDATITALGDPACQTITLSQDGLSSYLDSFMFEIVGLELFGGDLILSSLEVNNMAVPSGDILYDAGTQTTSLNIDGTYFPANSLSNPADNQMNTNEVVEVEVCYTTNSCPESADIPFNYLARWGCEDMDCETTSQTSFIKVRPTGSLPATATATLNAEGIEICGTPGNVSITLTNPNTNTDQNTYTDLEIGFQTCDKPNLEVTNVVVGGITVPSSYYEWVGDDINIDFTSNTDPGLGLVDHDGDGFYDDLLGGSMISAEITIEVTCGVGEGDCANINCEDVQFYVSGKTNCGSTFKGYPVPEMFDLIYGATSVENRGEVEIATGVLGYDFGTYSNDGAPLNATGPSTQEVEFCYSFEKLNIDDCPTGGTNFLRVEFSGAPAYILDLQFEPGTAQFSDDNGVTYTAVPNANVTLTKPSTSSAILEIGDGSNNGDVCYKYSVTLDTCLCLPNAFFSANQQVVHVCEDCDPDCEILKACNPVLFATNANCSPCPCLVQNRHVRSERKNFGYTDKTMTTMHTRESLLDSLAANGETSSDLTRFLPGDTLIHQDYFVITDELALAELSYWNISWQMFELGNVTDSISKLQLLPDAHNTVLTDFSVSKVGGSKVFADLNAILSCNSPGSVTTSFDVPNTPYPFATQNNHNSSNDYSDNNTLTFNLYNLENVETCGGDNGVAGAGNCLDDFISTYNISVGDTLHFTYMSPLIKNPHREVQKSLGTAPPPADFARIYPGFAVWKLDPFGGNASYCNTSVGNACREWGAFELDCPGEIDAVTRMDLNDCGGTVCHEFTVRDLPGPVGAPWYTQEFRPMMDLFDVDVLIRAPLAYCANARVEKFGITYDVSADSTINMFCNSVAGYDEDICAVETGNTGNVVFDIQSHGVPGLGVGFDNCDTLRLKYDLCMVCPGDITGVLDYTLVYDWAFSGTNHDVDRVEHSQYVCNSATATQQSRSFCDEFGIAGNYWDKLNLDTMMYKQDRISEVFLLNDMRAPLTPVSVTNNGPNLLSSGGPGVTIELQEIELCNPDVDDDATGVGMSVTIPSSVRLDEVYTDAAGTMALTKTLISDDGVNKVYKITFPTPDDTYIPGECNTFYVGTTLLFCPAPTDAPPKICVGAFSGCAPEDVKAALAASGGCAGSEICYTYIFGEVGLQTEWFDLPAEMDLCGTSTMNVLVKNTKELVLLDLVPMFDLPPGIQIVPGSWEVAYPGGPTTMGAWTNIPTDPDVVVGNTYSYSDDALWNAHIDGNGLQGISAANVTADSNKVAFRFQVMTICDEFLSGSKALTETTAADPCSDQVVSSGVVQSPPLIIAGADPADYANLLLVSNPEIINCEGSVNTFGITAINSGTQSTSDSVLICVTFPAGLEYQAGTVAFTSPAGFPVGMVTETPIGTSTEVCFSGPQVGPFGSISIVFDAAMDIDQECSDITLLADIKSFVEMVTCTPGPPTECGVFVQNSINNEIKVELAPPFVAEDIEVFTSCPTDGGNVELSYEFTINHNGPNASSQPYTVNFYEDVDGTQDINPNVDNLIGSESGLFSVNDGATVIVNGAVDVPDGQSCPVLFEVVYDTDCVCDRTEEYFDNIRFEGLKEYDEPLTMCPGSCIDIEICDHISVSADSIIGATGIPYTISLDWNNGNLYTLPHDTLADGTVVKGPLTAFLTYDKMTNNSIGDASGSDGFLFPEQSTVSGVASGNAWLVASYAQPVNVSSIFMGGGRVSGWNAVNNIGTQAIFRDFPMTIEYSNDGITWIQADAFVGPTSVAIEQHTLATPISAQYWRISSTSDNDNWGTTEFRLEGEGLPYEGFDPVTIAGNTATICIPDDVGADAAWPVTFTTGTGDCAVEETLEIYGIDSPGITIEGDTIACEGQCVDLEIIVPSDATAGMTVSWTPAILVDDPTAFRIEACNVASNTNFQATISYNDGACVDVIDWPVTYLPSNSINVWDNDLDCYNMLMPPEIYADPGWDTYNWYLVTPQGTYVDYSSSTNTFTPMPGATYYVEATRAGTICPATSSNFTIPNNPCPIDLGDLPDSGAGTTSNTDYETLLANNGPSHVIISGLYMGPNVDAEFEGQPSADALGDGSDENAISLAPGMMFTPGNTFVLPISLTNLTGSTSHFEAWIDWNGDGDFNDPQEMVADWNDGASAYPSNLSVNIPPFAVSNTLVGFRLRFSNTDNMTPYGHIEEGEIEDYLLGIDCKQVCLPLELEENDD